jgi:hypothetical protein
MTRHSTPAQRLRLLGHLPPRRHLRSARQATAASARRARTRRTPVAVGVVVVTPATPLRPLLPPLAPTPRFLPHGRPMSTHGRGTSSCTPVHFRAASSARLLPSSGIHTWAAAAGPVLAPGTSQLVTMDWFGLGPVIAGELLQHHGASSTTHYPRLGGCDRTTSKMRGFVSQDHIGGFSTKRECANTHK